MNKLLDIKFEQIHFLKCIYFKQQKAHILGMYTKIYA